MLRKTFPGIRFSSVYRSKAQHIENQADFLNAAASFETRLSPEEVAKKLRAIEKKLKKNPPEKFGPRTIDLDVLLFGQEISLDDELTIPHLWLHSRRFVLLPLMDLGAKDLMHPGFDRPLGDFLKETEDQHCEKTTIEL